MSWLVVLDPLEGLLSKTDTSIAIIEQARTQQIVVDTATTGKLFFEKKEAHVLATTSSGKEHVRKLADYSLILMRKEPPYDLAFHYATQLLSLSNTLVVNSPNSLRDFNEKLIALSFAQFMPPTLVSSNPDLISAFVEKEQDCVIKALDSFQGKSVQRLAPKDMSTIQTFTDNGKQYVMVQKFLERVYEGDKRVMMIGDQVLGAAMRKPVEGFHANFANSEALKTTLTKKETEIIAALGPWMVRQGIYFSGLDFIGEQLTEINITCPTGIVQISDLDNKNCAAEIVDYFISLVEQSNN